MRRLLLGILLVPAALRAQAKRTVLEWADSARVAIEAAQIGGSADTLREARALTERALVAFPGDPLLLHYDGYALYREAAQLSARGQAAAARPLLVQAATVLEQSAKRRPMAETSALLAVVYGQQIGLDPSKAMTLGMLSAQVMGEATALGAANPRVWLLRGISAIYTPPQYGGGPAVAEEYLAKAVALFDRDHAAPGAPTWGRAEAHAWLGIAYQRAGDLARAAAEYRAALAIEPGYAWVKTTLLPGLAKPGS